MYGRQAAGGRAAGSWLGCEGCELLVTDWSSCVYWDLFINLGVVVSRCTVYTYACCPHVAVAVASMWIDRAASALSE